MSLVTVIKVFENKDIVVMEIEDSQFPAGDNWGTQVIQQAILGSGNISSGDGTVGNPLLTKIFVDASLTGDGTLGAPLSAFGLIVGLWNDRGGFDASVNAYPSSGGSGTAGAILKGDIWTITVAGTLPTGQVVEIGDTVRALINTPGNTQANWSILQNNVGYVSENQANKSDNTLLGTSTVLYPTQNAVKVYVDSLTDFKNSRDFDIIDHAFDFLGGSTLPYDIQEGNGGSLSNVNSANGTTGIMRFSIGTNANSRARICGLNSKMIFFDAVKTGVGFRIKKNTLPAVGDEYVTFLGVSGGVSITIASQTNVVGMFHDRTNLSGLNPSLFTGWVLLSIKATVPTVINTGIAVDTSWHNITLESNSVVDGNLHFWIDGVDVGNFTPAQLPLFDTITTQLQPDVRLNRVGLVGLATKTLDLDFRRIYKKY